MKLNNLRIGVRLGAAFALVLALLVGLAAVGVANMAKLNAGTAQLVEQDWVKAKLASEALDQTRGSIARVFQLVASDDDATAAAARARIHANLGGLDEALSKLAPLLHKAEGKELLRKITLAREQYGASSAEVLRLAAAGQREQAAALAYGACYAQLQTLARELRALMDFQRKLFEQQGVDSRSTYENGVMQMAALGVLATVLGTLLAWWITRSITMPLEQAVRVAETVAAGDLDSDIAAAGRDETARLMRALRAMNDSLAKVVGEVRSGTELIATASAEIANGNMDLSGRTETQASALEQTASSMEELTSTVRQNADNARQANALARSATRVAEQGGAVVAQVVSTMGHIDASARKIVDITGVIDGIAFQTNILALNAAVEAARAGEQGRGFAVVATEVRTLAQRAAAAAKEIKLLIDDSVQQTGIGSRLVEQAGATMQEVVGSIARVSGIVAEISAASQEQADGIEQVNQAIVNMDDVTQQNAALVEQSAAAAGSLQEQAANLLRVVGVFKTARPAAAAPRPAVRVVPAPASRAVVLAPAKRAPAPPPLRLAAAGADWVEF